MIYAYVLRFDTIDCDSVRAQLFYYGVKEKDIYFDTVNPKSEQPQLEHLLNLLKPKDVLILRSLYDLSNDFEEMSRKWHRINLVLDVDIVVLDTPLIDTRRNEHNIDRKFIIDMVEDLLSYLGKNQKAIQQVKQIKGIQNAKEKGVRFGRPQKVDWNLNLRVMKKYESNSISLEEAMALLNVKKTTFYKYYNQYKALKEN